MAESTPSFVSLLEVHRSLNEQLLEHQECLLARDLPGAREHFTRFDRELRAQLRVEAEVLLPVYAQCTPKAKEAPVAFFAGEHKKIQQNLSALQAALDTLTQRDEVTPRDILDVLDRECIFRHILGHYDSRLENALLPALDTGTSEERRQEIWRRIQAAR